MHYHYQMDANYSVSATVHLKTYSEFEFMGNYRHFPQNPQKKVLLPQRIYNLELLSVVIMFTCTFLVASVSFNNGAFKCKYHQHA